MVGPDINYSSARDHELFKIWMTLSEWNSSKEDASRLVEIMHQYNGLAAVIDDYRVDEEYQLILRDSGVKWLQFESRYDKPIWADWLLYANPGAKVSDFYSSLRRADTHLMVGAQFAILREEFSNIVPRKNGKIENILVVFGGGDDRGAITFTLAEILNNFGELITVKVISGAGNPNNHELSRYISRCGEKVKLIIDPQNIAEIMSSSDLAITSGGTLTYELAACNVPMIIIALSEDQRASLAWQYLNCGLYLGCFSELKEGEITTAIDRMMRDNELVAKMKMALSETVDGQGAVRVSANVLKELGVL